MELSLIGKRAMVCGSTRGIGRACADALAVLGASIVLVARNRTLLEEALRQLPAADGQVHSLLTADFSRPDELKAALEAFMRTTERVHILVNNTGGPPGGEAIDAAPDDFLSAFRQHVICNQMLVQSLVPGMTDAGYGRIINIISTSVKQPIPGLGVSNTVRGAVANWAKTLANELGPRGITVNNVLPGATRTDRLSAIIEQRAKNAGRSTDEVAQAWAESIPARRFAEPAEVANAVAFLASPAASYINGINLPVDGGRVSSL